MVPEAEPAAAGMARAGPAPGRKVEPEGALATGAGTAAAALPIGRKVEPEAEPAAGAAAGAGCWTGAAAFSLA